MKIYTRRARSIRHLILALLWLALVIYQLYLGLSIGPREVLFLLAAMVFGALFYWEWKTPYVSIEAKELKVGLFAKRKVDLSKVDSFEAKTGYLKIHSGSNTTVLNMMRLSQKDREQIYGVLKTKMPDEEESFRKDHAL